MRHRHPRGSTGVETMMMMCRMMMMMRHLRHHEAAVGVVCGRREGGQRGQKAVVPQHAGRGIQRPISDERPAAQLLLLLLLLLLTAGSCCLMLLFAGRFCASSSWLINPRVDKIVPAAPATVPHIRG